MMNKLFWAAFIVILMFFPGGSDVVAQDLYSTGFEIAENPSFSVGPLPQNGWIHVTGPSISSVTDGLSFEDDQSLQIAPEGVVSTTLSSESNSVVYIDSWFFPTLSPSLLDLPGLSDSSAIFVFHTVNGIVLLDGDGTGGGNWVNTGFTDLNDFIRITVCLDFVAKTWDIYINTTLLGQNLGFKDNSITSLSGLRMTSAVGSSSFLDTFLVTTTTPSFVVTPTPTETQTPTPTSTPTPSPTLTPSVTNSPTFTLPSTATFTPTPTSLPIGSAEFWFRFAISWKNPANEDNKIFNSIEDSTIDALDLLFLLKDTRNQVP